MAAGSYRGLTISIGGDVTKLSAALRTANSAISSTETQARRLKQALALDPGNQGAMDKYIANIGRQADETALKVTQLRSAYKQIAESQAGSTGKTFGEWSEEIGDANVLLGQTRERLAGVTGELATIYTNISGRVKAAVKSLDGDFASMKKEIDAWGGKQFRFNIKTDSIDKIRTALERVPGKSKEEIDAIIKRIQDLRSLYSQFTTKSGEAIKFDVSNSEIGDIEKMLERLSAFKKESDGNLFDESAIRSTVDLIKQLKDTFNGVELEYDDAETLAAMKDLETVMEQTEAKAKSLNSEFSRLNGSQFAAGARQYDQELTELSEDAQVLTGRLSLIDRAAQLNPLSISNFTTRIKTLIEAYSNLRNQAEGVRKQMSSYEAAGIDKLAANTRNAAENARRAKKEYDDASLKVRLLVKELEDAESKTQQMQETASDSGDEYDKLQQRISEIPDELMEACAEANRLGEAFDTAQAVAEYQTLQDKMLEIKATMADLMQGASLGSVGASALILAEQVGQYARQGFDEIIQNTMELDDAFANVRKTVEGTDDEFQALYDDAVAMSKVQPVSADTILNIEALGGQLGFELDDLQEFSRVVSGLEISTNMDWQSAATNMAQFANIMKMNKDEVGNYGSAIVALGNHFATTESDISDMALRIAGAGRDIGLTEADVLGLSTALTSMGLTAEAGGSSISQIMVKIDKAVAHGVDGVSGMAEQVGMEANAFVEHIKSLDKDGLDEFAKTFNTTGKKLKKDTVDQVDYLNTWARTAKMSVDDFVDAWENDPIEVIKSVFSGMEEASVEGSNLNLMLEELGITTIRQSDVARRLANNASMVTDAVDMANEAYAANSALTTEVDKRNESLSAKYEVLRNNINAVWTELGEGLMPLIVGATDLARSFADALNEMPTGLKEGIVTAMAGFAGVAVVKPAIVGIGGAIANLLGDISGLVLMGIGPLVDALISAGGVAAGFGSAIATILLNPFALAAVAAAGVIGGVFISKLLKAKKESENFSKALDGLKSTADDVTSSISVGSSSIKSFDSSVGRVMSVEEITDDINDFNESVREIQDPVTESNQLLGEYKNVIDQLSGKQQASANDMARLEWAVDGLNEVLGTNFTAQDVLLGKYQDEESEIDNLMGYIDRLIEKRQLQAEVEAAQSIYTESLKEQMKLQEAADAAARQYNDELDKQFEYYRNNDNAGFTDGFFSNMSREDFEDWFIESERLKAGSSEFLELRDSMVAAQEAADAVGDSVERYEDRMSSLYEKSSSYDFISDAFSDKDFSWGKALDDAHISVTEFLDALEPAGIGLENLQAIYNDTGVYFADMVEESGGDMERLISIIQEYNAQHPEVEVELKTQEAQRAADAFMDEQASAYNQPIDILVTAEDEATPTIQTTLEGLNAMPNEVTASIKGDMSDLAKKTSDANSKIKGVKQDSPVKLNADASGVYTTVASAQESIDSVHGTTVDVTARLVGADSINSLIDRLSRTYTLRYAVQQTNPTVNPSSSNAAGSANGFASSSAASVLTRLGSSGSRRVTLANGSYSNGEGRGDTILNVNLNYKAGDDANKVARDIGRALERQMRARR